MTRITTMTVISAVNAPAPSSYHTQHEQTMDRNIDKRGVRKDTDPEWANVPKGSFERYHHGSGQDEPESYSPYPICDGEARK